MRLSLIEEVSESREFSRQTTNNTVADSRTSNMSSRLSSMNKSYKTMDSSRSAAPRRDTLNLISEVVDEAGVDEDEDEDEDGIEEEIDAQILRNSRNFSDFNQEVVNEAMMEDEEAQNMNALDASE